MKNTIKGGVAALGIAGAIAAATGTAHADVEGELNDHSGRAYATELHEDGIPGTVSQAVSLASTICSDRAEGVAERTLEERAGELEGTYHDGLVLVDGAEFHFCPGYELAANGQHLWIQDPSGIGGWSENPAAVPTVPRGTVTAWAEPR